MVSTIHGKRILACFSNNVLGICWLLVVGLRRCCKLWIMGTIHMGYVFQDGRIRLESLGTTVGQLHPNIIEQAERIPS